MWRLYHVPFLKQGAILPLQVMVPKGDAMPLLLDLLISQRKLDTYIFMLNYF